MKKQTPGFERLFYRYWRVRNHITFNRMRKLVYFFFAFACATSAWAQCSSLVYDDFETASMNPAWSQGGSYVRTFPTAGAPQGTYFLQQAGGNFSHYAGSIWNFTPSTPTYIGWWSMTNTNTNNCSYMVIGDASTSSNNGIVFCYFTSSGTVRFYNNTANFETPTVANTWYHFELMNINYTSKTFDLYINGVLTQSNYAFRSTASTDVSQIHLYNYDSNCNGFYDQVVVGGMPLNVTATHTDVTCFGDTTGSASANVTSGTPPYTYAWSTGGTNSSISGLGVGTFSVTVTDGNSCTTTQSVTITEPTALADSSAVTDPTCSYSADGSIAFTVSGGTPGYTYTWNTGDTTASLMNIGGGTYYVDYTDANGCSGTDTFTVTAPPALGFTAVAIDILCAGGSHGALDVTPTGGTPGYTYLWSNGDTTQDLIGVPANLYILTVTDVNGCEFMDTLYIDEPPALVSAGVVTDDVGGVGSGAVDLTVNGGVSPYTYVWSNGDTTQDLSGVFTGTYTVTITDANGCITLDTFFVDFIEALVGMNRMDVKLWPVPFTAELQVELPQTFEGGVVELWDVQGRLAHRRTVGIEEKVILDTRELASGAYLLKVESGGKIAIHRVVKN
jgi:hypothetical protein